MYTVPAGPFPAAAAAAAMLNVELGACAYDVALAARTGALSRVAAPPARESVAGLTHASRPRFGCVFVFPMQIGDTHLFFETQVQPLLDAHVGHLRDAPRLVGSGFHYRVWAPPPYRDLPSRHVDHTDHTADSRMINSPARRTFVYDRRFITSLRSLKTFKRFWENTQYPTEFTWQIHPATLCSSPNFELFGDAVALWHDAVVVDTHPLSSMVEARVPHLTAEMTIPNMSVNYSVLVVFPAADDEPCVRRVYEWKRPQDVESWGPLCRVGGWTDSAATLPSVAVKFSPGCAAAVTDMLRRERVCALCRGALFMNCGAVVGHAGVSALCMLCAGSGHMERLRKLGAVVCSWACSRSPPGFDVRYDDGSVVWEVCGRPGEAVVAHAKNRHDVDDCGYRLLHREPRLRSYERATYFSGGVLQLRWKVPNPG